jgi:hypothetical protein
VRDLDNHGQAYVYPIFIDALILSVILMIFISLAPSLAAPPDIICSAVFNWNTAREFPFLLRRIKGHGDKLRLFCVCANALLTAEHFE